MTPSDGRRLPRPEEGWLTLGLVLLVVLILAWAVDDPGWVNGKRCADGRAGLVRRPGHGRRSPGPQGRLGPLDDPHGGGAVRRPADPDPGRLGVQARRLRADRRSSLTAEAARAGLPRHRRGVAASSPTRRSTTSSCSARSSGPRPSSPRTRCSGTGARSTRVMVVGIVLVGNMALTSRDQLPLPRHVQPWPRCSCSSRCTPSTSARHGSGAGSAIRARLGACTSVAARSSSSAAVARVLLLTVRASVGTAGRRLGGRERPAHRVRRDDQPAVPGRRRPPAGRGRQLRLQRAHRRSLVQRRWRRLRGRRSGGIGAVPLAGGHVRHLRPGRLGADRRVPSVRVDRRDAAARRHAGGPAPRADQRGPVSVHLRRRYHDALVSAPARPSSSTGRRMCSSPATSGWFGGVELSGEHVPGTPSRPVRSRGCGDTDGDQRQPPAGRIRGLPARTITARYTDVPAGALGPDANELLADHPRGRQADEPVRHSPSRSRPTSGTTPTSPTPRTSGRQLRRPERRRVLRPLPAGLLPPLRIDDGDAAPGGEPDEPHPDAPRAGVPARDRAPGAWRPSATATPTPGWRSTSRATAGSRSTRPGAAWEARRSSRPGRPSRAPRRRRSAAWRRTSRIPRASSTASCRRNGAGGTTPGSRGDGGPLLIVLTLLAGCDRPRRGLRRLACAARAGELSPMRPAARMRPARVPVSGSRPRPTQTVYEYAGDAGGPRAWRARGPEHRGDREGGDDLRGRATSAASASTRVRAATRRLRPLLRCFRRRRRRRAPPAPSEARRAPDALPECAARRAAPRRLRASSSSGARCAVEVVRPQHGPAAAELHHADPGQPEAEHPELRRAAARTASA